MNTTENIHELAIDGATTTTKTAGIGRGLLRFGGAVAIGTISVITADLALSGIRKLTGAEKRAKEKADADRELQIAKANERFRNQMNEMTDRMAAAVGAAIRENNARQAQAEQAEPTKSKK